MRRGPWRLRLLASVRLKHGAGTFRRQIGGVPRRSRGDANAGGLGAREGAFTPERRGRALTVESGQEAWDCGFRPELVHDFLTHSPQSPREADNHEATATTRCGRGARSPGARVRVGRRARPSRRLPLRIRRRQEADRHRDDLRWHHGYTGKTCSWTHNGTTTYVFTGASSTGTRARLGEDGTTVKGTVFKGRVPSAEMGAFAAFHSGNCDHR